MESRLYLLIDVLVFLGPLTRAFESRIFYIGKWKRLLAATLAVFLLFLPWDFFGLPLEEVLFFVVVPWACYFIYEVLQLFFPWKGTQRWVYTLTLFAALGCIGWAMKHPNQAYTFWTFLLLGAGLGLAFVWKPTWLAAFYRAWGLALLPFFAVNGLLTGSFLEEPIVWYNNAENMGIRMGTIPVEDAFYGMLMMLLYTAVVQWKKVPKSST